jgi:L-fucose isomerase
VLFADLRHYHEKLDLYDLVNSGQHAPWFAKRAAKVDTELESSAGSFPASEFYFRGGGGSVQFYAAPAKKVTFGRIVRKRGHHVMHLFTGSFEKLTRRTEEKLAKQTTYEWPHAFAKFRYLAGDVARSTTPAITYHAVIGDHVAALIAAAENLGIEPVVLS